MNYIEATEFLLGLPDMERCQRGARARTMSLDAMHSLLARLGNPELGRKTVHVTGSKGKGSTSVFLASMLAGAARTSLYTSPHLHSYRERICIDLSPVSPENFAAGVLSIKDAVIAEHQGALGPISTFGAMTCLFFCLSRSAGMEWQVVEVGMGGRHDASNVFADKKMAVITAISLEHTNMLGKSTLEIAENKAGLIRPGCIVVLAPQKDPSVTALIKQKCLDLDARLIDVADEYRIIPESYDSQRQRFSLLSSGRRRGFQINMLGEHQLDNAVTAIAAVDALNQEELLLSESDLQNSLRRVSLPGRLELVHRAPRVVVDGAHNGESASALLSALRRHFSVSSVDFVLGVNSDKNILEILRSIKPLCRKLIITRSQNEKAMDPQIIAASAKSLAMDYQVTASSVAALEEALPGCPGEGLVCATGSLYLVAEIREHFLGANPLWTLMTAPVNAPTGI